MTEKEKDCEICVRYSCPRRLKPFDNREAVRRRNNVSKKRGDNKGIQRV